MRLSRRRLNRTLLRRQRLLERVRSSPAEMATHLVGLQAQENLPPYLSLAARLATDHPDVVTVERSRYGAVLLDEYQDTGHAQRILLRSLFGGGTATHSSGPLPVTAVGDPAQAIYGWRGASAANLTRFVTDFPRRDEAGQLRPAERYGLLTSFRNPPEVLRLANVISAPVRTIDDLRPRQDAGPGDIRCALLPDVQQEIAWLADGLAARWFGHVEATGIAPTAAVLVRRRADMAELFTAIEQRLELADIEIVARGHALEAVALQIVVGGPGIAHRVA